MNAGQNAIGGRGNGHGKLGGQPSECVVDASGARCPDPNRVAPVGVKSGACIPPVLPCRDQQVVQSLGLTWTRTRLPGGAMGVQL